MMIHLLSILKLIIFTISSLTSSYLDGENSVDSIAHSHQAYYVLLQMVYEENSSLMEMLTGNLIIGCMI